MRKSKQFNKLVRELVTLDPCSGEYDTIMHKTVSTYKITVREVRLLVLYKSILNLDKYNVYELLVTLPKDERPEICLADRTVKVCGRPLKIFSHY